VVRRYLSPVGRAHHANLYLQHPRARHTGFYHGSELPRTGLRLFALPRSYAARPGRASLRRMGDATRDCPPFPSRLPSFLLQALITSPSM
jgi:hypothetical protein